MTLNDALSFIRSLPKASLIDPLKLAGNLSQEEKQLSANTFAFFAHQGYGSEVGRQMKLVEGSTSKEGDETVGLAIVELTVTPSMCNSFGTLHGGCSAYIIDQCSSAAIVNGSLAGGADGTGVSLNMSIVWNAPATVGDTLRIVSTATSVGGRIRFGRSELWNKDTGKLLASGTHSTMAPKSKPKL